MNPDDAIDFGREAIKTCMMVGGPILVASLLIGLLIGVFQAMTQVQDQTVSFVPKILLLIVMIGLCLPWLTDRMMAFATQSFEKPMSQWAGTSNAPALMFPESKETSSDQHTAQNRPTRNSASRVVMEVPNSTPARFASNRFVTKPAAQVRPSETRTEPQAAPDPSIEAEITPSKPPFMLPHYRTIKSTDKPDTSG